MIDKLESIKDLVIIIVISILLWFILSKYDAFELIVGYLETHEEYELDELLLLLIILGFLSIVYSIRRVIEARRINNQLENINSKLEKKVQEEILKNKEKEFLLLQQSKMASMGEMLGNIAHQWRQPLNALSLVTQNIQFAHQMNELDDEFLYKSIKKANLLTSNMSKTIDDFRFFYKPNKGKNRFNLFEVKEKCLNLVDTSFEHNGIKIESLGDNEIYLYGFPNELAQVVINILNNAKDALIDNKIENAKVTCNLYKDNSFGYIEIRDNAGGIAENILNKIFEPYFTTKEEGKGTGIGLYMSKIIVEQNMNGKLYVENIDNGVSFLIKLPLYIK